MERCTTCGHELPSQPIRLGDFVEWICGGSRLAVVTSLHVMNPLVTVLILTGPRKGDADTYHPSSLRVVHGHIHVDRLRASLVPADMTSGCRWHYYNY